MMKMIVFVALLLSVGVSADCPLGQVWMDFVREILPMDEMYQIFVEQYDEDPCLREAIERLKSAEMQAAVSGVNQRIQRVFDHVQAQLAARRIVKREAACAKPSLKRLLAELEDVVPVDEFFARLSAKLRASDDCRRFVAAIAESRAFVEEVMDSDAMKSYVAQMVRLEVPVEKYRAALYKFFNWNIMANNKLLFN